jgi:hypothetical protein
MIVLNDIHTSCMEVTPISGVINFIEMASMIMTSFVSMAAGRKMVFPTRTIMNALEKEFSGKMGNGEVQFVLKIREMLIYNTYELYAEIIDNCEKITSIEDTKSIGEHIKPIMTFSCIPESENV